MRIPGQKRNLEPDVVGQRAGKFAEAIRDNAMNEAWAMLSKETRGMRLGVWATRQNIDMQHAYRAAYDEGHPMRPAMLEDFRQTVLRNWPLDDLDSLSIAPTNYIDDTHAFAFLPFTRSANPIAVARRRLMNGLIIPMIFEEEEWRVDLPGWRFLSLEDQRKQQPE